METIPNIFDYSSYKNFLRTIAGEKNQRKGNKSAIANAIQCQQAYLSQVLYGDADLSLEQIEALSSFLNHGAEEKEFLILLLLKDRAGTQRLKSHFQQQITNILRRRLVITERLGSHEHISEEDKSKYYSSWIYSAVHIATTIPGLRSVRTLCDYLNVPPEKIIEVLKFLRHVGLVVNKKNEYLPTTKQMRLGNDSTNITKHHTNWRVRTLEALDREKISDLHYSAVVSLSHEDALKIKDAILEGLKNNLKKIRDSKEEVLYCYNIDFFSMKNDP